MNNKNFLLIAILVVMIAVPKAWCQSVSINERTHVLNVLVDGKPLWLLDFDISSLKSIPSFKTRNDLIYTSQFSRKHFAVVWNEEVARYATYFRIDSFYRVYKNATPYERQYLKLVPPDANHYIQSLIRTYAGIVEPIIFQKMYDSDEDFMAYVLAHHIGDLKLGILPYFRVEEDNEKLTRNFSSTYNRVLRRIGVLK
jgi:hypothetical protein